MEIQINRNWVVELSKDLDLPQGVRISTVFYSEDYGFLLLEGNRYYTVPGGKEVKGDKYKMVANNEKQLPLRDKVTKQPIIDAAGKVQTIGELDAWLLKYHQLMGPDIINAVKRKEKIITTPLVIEV